MIKGKTFLRAEILGLGGTDIEVRIKDSSCVWVDVCMDTHGLKQLDTLRRGLEDLRNRFPTRLVEEANEENACG